VPDEGSRISQNPLRKIAGFIKERTTVQKALNLAAKRQKLMLPAVPQVPGYEFAPVYLPAEHVSGDFYDIIDLGGGRYGLLVGDVSGHGMEAGIVTGAARKALQIYARSGDGPAAVLVRGNDDLGRELDRETFLTVGYAVLETAGGSMRYVRAGHTPPLVMGPGPGKWQVIKSRGVMVGAVRGEGFAKSLEEVGLELHPGQSFIQYTDGLAEARERGGDEFGTDRIIEYLDREAGSGKPLAEAVEGLAAEVLAWTGGAPQEDDITILAVRRTG